jgi:hypothetical protein
VLPTFTKGDFDRAIADLDKVIKFNPKDSSAYFNRGRVYLREGDDDRAIADLNKAFIEHGRTRSTVIEQEAVVPVVHLQQRCAGESRFGAVSNEPTLSKAQVAIGVGKTDNEFLGHEGLCPDRNRGGICKRGPEFEHRHFLGVEARNAEDAGGNQHLPLLARTSISFQSVAERCMASATCAAVTINRGVRNQPVPRAPSMAGHFVRIAAGDFPDLVPANKVDIARRNLRTGQSLLVCRSWCKAALPRRS